MHKKRLYRVARSGIHNRGLFAAADIPEGEYIIQYRGEKITKAESQRRGLDQHARGRKNRSGQVYIFEINKRYDLDGSRRGNPARYINHHCEPNCEAVNYRGEIWITARRPIALGEELTYDYGFALEHFLDHPCRCSATSCPGYIVNDADRPKLRRLLARKIKQAS